MLNKLLKFIDVKLNLFDEPEPEPSAEPSPSETPVNGQQETGEKVQLVYGNKEPEQKTEPVPTTEEPSKDATPDPTQLKAEWEENKKKFKEFYDMDVQGHIKDRVKKFKGIEHQLNQANPLLNFLKEQYGAEDYNTIYNKLVESQIEQLAEQNDMTPEMYREHLELKQKVAEFEQQKEFEQTQKIISDWQSQSQELQKEYPDFDLVTMMENPQFEAMLKSGVPVKGAYAALNFENITASAAKKAEQNTVANIQARGKRPVENATKTSPGVAFKPITIDLSTREGRAEAARRASMGESLSLD